MSVTPFLHDNFGVSISFVGQCMIFLAVGMVAGCLLTGLLFYTKKLNQYTVMALGSVFVFLGLLLAIPPTFIPPLYKAAPITVSFGIFLVGLGYPLVTITTLTALYDLQVRIIISTCVLLGVVHILLRNQYFGNFYVIKTKVFLKTAFLHDLCYPVHC